MGRVLELGFFGATCHNLAGLWCNVAGCVITVVIWELRTNGAPDDLSVDG